MKRMQILTGDDSGYEEPRDYLTDERHVDFSADSQLCTEITTLSRATSRLLLTIYAVNFQYS